MTLAWLFLRSRLAGWALLWLLVSALGGWLVLSMVDEVTVAIALIVVPLVPAVLIGASAHSPFGDVEDVASISLPALRLSHLLGLLALGGLLLALVASGWEVGDIQWELARNLAGYTGLALLCGRLLGSSVAWVAPLGYATITLYLDPDSHWAWLMHVPADRWSLLVALALVTVGLLAAMHSGEPERQNER